jgi:hypothetical protein
MPWITPSRGSNPRKSRKRLQITLWAKAALTGADLLWRVKSNAVPPVEKRYSDGSFASHVYPGTTARRNDADGIAVRVIEYTLTADNTDTAERTYRLITTIVDPAAAPAAELAGLYSQRWEIETALAEDPSARPQAGAALQDARRGDPGGVWLPVRALRDPLADAFGGNRLRA